MNPFGPGLAVFHVLGAQAQNGPSARVQLIAQGLSRAQVLCPNAKVCADQGEFKLFAHLAQVALGALAPGNVTRHAQLANDVAQGIAHGHLDDLKDSGVLAIRTRQFFFKSCRLAAPQRALVGASQAQGDLIARKIGIGFANDMGRRVTKMMLKRGVAGLVSARGVFQPDQVRNGMNHGAEQHRCVVQFDLGVVQLGDVLHRAFKIQRGAAVILDDMGVLADPDALARVVAVNFGNKIHHPPVGLKQCLELVAPPRLDVPFACNVVDRNQHFCLKRVTVEANQGCVGTQLAAFRRGPVGPNGQQVKQR